MLKKLGLICSLILLFTSIGKAQNKVTTVGIQFKPIVPYKLLNTGTTNYTGEKVDFKVDPKVGYSFGMVIRSGLTKTISIESGINYIARKYRLQVNEKSTASIITTDMVFEGYEIPLTALVFIQLGRKTYMNSAFGCSFDFYPTGGIVANKASYEFGILESSWAQASLLANLGFEYRTDKSGYFYFGASFHRPFSKTADLFLSQRIENSNNFNRFVESELLGNYLTIDLRYFFAENITRKKQTQ
jgi:hypothetical protein